MSQQSAPINSRVKRRTKLRRAQNVFGLEFVHPCAGGDRKNRKFWLHLLGRRPDWLEAQNIRVEDVNTGTALSVRLHPDELIKDRRRLDRILLIAENACENVDYALTINPLGNESPKLDPYFNRVVIRFACQPRAEIDCVTAPPAPPQPPAVPEINYLAKDYATFRQLLLDRLAITQPDWQERCPADLGIMLVEILAYVADRLSYYQDAVATEAYLGTARLRQSLRRHARLVDYAVHEGCNARAWVYIRVLSDCKIPKAHELFFVSIPRSSDLLRSRLLTSAALEQLTKSGCEVFEPVVSKSFELWESHNECRLYDWQQAERCLPKGATSAWLIKPNSDEDPAGKSLHFAPGDVLLLEEVLGPRTGCSKDADGSHRHFVRITEVEDDFDDLFDVALLKITWEESDALPFTLWITKPDDAVWDCDEQLDVSVARGNILLVDHGRRVLSADVNVEVSHAAPPAQFESHYPPATVAALLSSKDLTFSQSLPKSGEPASQQLKQDPHLAVPQIILQAKRRQQRFTNELSFLELRDEQRVAERVFSRFNAADARPHRTAMPRAAKRAAQLHRSCGCAADASGLIDLCSLRNAIRNDLQQVWQPRHDLLESSSSDKHFVVEMTDERLATLRFGQNGFGLKPDLVADPTLAEMVADFRVGNGTSGNVPAEAIQAFGSYGSSYPEIESVRNPKPAVGGVDPKLPNEVRLFAPHAIRSQLQRAVTPRDYEQIVMREFGETVQRAKATFLWTGHELRILVAIDARGSEEPRPDLLTRIEALLHRHRRIGHSVRVRAATHVVPVIKLAVCLGRHVVGEQVRLELDRVFSDQVLANGSLAFFHPDQATFGEGVFTSQIVSAAAAIPGIVHVEVLELHRRNGPPRRELKEDVLRLRADEVVRFDNDRSQPKHGVLEISFKGGR
jgi:hypothetical protein